MCVITTITTAADLIGLDAVTSSRNHLRLGGGVVDTNQVTRPNIEQAIVQRTRDAHHDMAPDAWKVLNCPEIDRVADVITVLVESIDARSIVCCDGFSFDATSPGDIAGIHENNNLPTRACLHHKTTLRIEAVAIALTSTSTSSSSAHNPVLEVSPNRRLDSTRGRALCCVLGELRHAAQLIRLPLAKPQHPLVKRGGLR